MLSQIERQTERNDTMGGAVTPLITEYRNGPARAVNTCCSGPNHPKEIQVATNHRTQATSVYKYFDLNDLLLYVGITSRGTQRQGEHNATKEWWKFVVRQEVEHYVSRPQAADREKELIRAYRPPFNKQHNLGHEETRAAYIALATKNGLKSRNVYPALVKGHGKTRLSMDVERIGNMLILRSLPDDQHKIHMLDTGDREKLILAGNGDRGIKPRLDKAVIDDGRLVIHLQCRRHVEKVRRADVLLRMPGGPDRQPATLKRIDLYTAGAEITNGA